MASLPGKRDLQHRGDERRGKAVARNVSDEDAEVLVVNLDEVVEIAGDGSHGKKTSGDLESGQLRNRVRKDRELNLASHLEFIVEGKELRGELGPAFAKQDGAPDASLSARGVAS